MSPRPYNLGKRQGQINQVRQQIVGAARALLAEATAYTRFTVDAVATGADVARATVYYQFGSKTGLLEAVCDELADAGQMSELTQAFTNPEPTEGIRMFVTSFGRFYDADRLVMRRLRALAALDPDVGAVIAARDQRRREGLRVLIDRIIESSSKPAAVDREETVRILSALTSFETFDTLTPVDQHLATAVPAILRLVQSVLHVALDET